MVFTYVWIVSDMPLPEAVDKFSRLLNDQCSLYKTAWGITPEYKVHQENNVLIGLIHHDSGVKGWKSWVEHAQMGLAWNGVCENYLGIDLDNDKTRQLLNLLENPRANLQDWDGWFSVTSWDSANHKVVITTGATESPTLWYTKGPKGWAMGSRAAPILEMVEGRKSPAMGTLNLYLAYGYLIDDSSLFANVQRLPSRTQVVIKDGGSPHIYKYLSLAEYLDASLKYTRREDIIDACAEQLVKRVSRQLNHSSNPKVLLTGGRDSRCIAAAASQTDHPFILSTGGCTGSKDYIIAKDVAERLSIKHEYSGDRAEFSLMADADERLKLWTQLSEGIETLKHATAYPGFFSGNPAAHTDTKQFFHGLGSYAFRGGYYRHLYGTEKIKKLETPDLSPAHKIVLDRIYPLSTLRGEARRQLQAEFSLIDEDLHDAGPTAIDWLDLFVWQRRDLHWGADMVSVKSPMFWVWSPLLDSRLLRITRNLGLEDKTTSRFMDDLIAAIAPSLAGLEFDIKQGYYCGMTFSQSINAAIKKWARRSDALSLHLMKKPEGAAADPELSRFWKNIFYGMEGRIWTEFLKEKTLDSLIDKNPTSDILWNAATIQLFCEVYC